MGGVGVVDARVCNWTGRHRTRVAIHQRPNATTYLGELVGVHEGAVEVVRHHAQRRALVFVLVWFDVRMMTRSDRPSPYRTHAYT